MIQLLAVEKYHTEVGDIFGMKKGLIGTLLFFHLSGRGEIV
jgi:hypothetical protein